MDATKIGALIKSARKTSGITQGELAKILDINRATVSKYESGVIVPSLGQLGEIAKAVGVTVYDLIGNDWSTVSGIDMTDAFNQTVSSWNGNPLLSTDEGSPSNDIHSSSEYKKRMNAAFDSLTAEGKAIAVQLLEIIAGNPSYRRDYSTATGTGSESDDL